jgi:hypothetical protein
MTMENLINQRQFIGKLVEAFPEIESELNDEDIKGTLSFEVGVFLRYTQKAINTGDEITVEKCFRFVDAILPLINHSVTNSIFVSYLEHLDFSRQSSYFNLLSSQLQSVIRQLEAYHKDSGSNRKLRDFLDSIK